MFFAEMNQTIGRMDVNPTQLKDKTLLDYHRKTHMLYVAALKRKPINKKVIAKIVARHDIYVREMQKRGMNHNSPLRRI